MANINKRLKHNKEINEQMKKDENYLLDKQAKQAKRKKSLKSLIMASIIAALYVGMTIAVPAISYSMIQFRLSEILVALVYFEPAALPGLCIGCFVADLLGPGVFYDAVIGTCGTAFGLYVMKWYGQHGGKPTIGMMLYALINAFLIGLELSYISGIGTEHSFIVLFLWVLLGEVATAVVGGSALYMLFKKRWKDLIGATETSEE